MNLNEERDAALLVLDLEWARREAAKSPAVVAGRLSIPNDFSLLAAMHKARIQLHNIPLIDRCFSYVWLREHDMQASS